MEYHRRDFLRATLGAMVAPLVGCAVHNRSSLRCPAALTDFERVNDLGPLPVYRLIQGTGPAILLLHELSGMSLSNLALARCLANEGFSVFVPLMFGEPGQERFFGGYFQSCARAEFDCSSPTGGSAILHKLRETRRKLVERTGAPIGIIGMCLTGVFPLALLGDRVSAAILCQPTLPFNALLMRPIGEQKRALALSRADIDHARRTNIPLLAMRYQSDPLCPAQRFDTLREMFGSRIALIEIGDEPQGHSALAWDLNDDAFGDAIKYLKVCLGVDKRAQNMKLAKVAGRTCEMTAQGEWRAL